MQSDAQIYKERTFSTPEEEIAYLRSELMYYKQELEKLKRMIFGSKSERYIPANDGQLRLGLDIEPIEKKVSEKEEITYIREKPEKSARINHARTPIPAHLPREEYVIDPEGDLSGARKIGEEITEILEYKPGKLFVKKYIRNKYALPQDGGIVIGELPSLPIPRGNAGAGLLAHLIVNKYVDHLPFYRQVQQFKREGIELAASTISGWFTAVCNLLEPLYDRLREKIIQSSYLMVDETPIAVLTKDKPGSTHKGYYWVYYSPLDRLVCFDYQKGRGRDGPDEFLKGYYGTIQTDGYSVYDAFEKPGKIVLLSCMAHARRKFDEALNNDPQGAAYVLSQMQRLYKVERQAREGNFSFEQRKELRKKESIPVLNELDKWMKDKVTEVLPKSAMGIALTYTLGLWNRLIRYTDDGRYEIDNNLVENSIRPVALGRKNYMFAGSHEAAARAAMIYSFLGTCKKNNVNYYDWLKDILERIPDHKANRLMELLPGEWIKQSSTKKNIILLNT